MNMKQSSPDIKRLHTLIVRYFDATATEDEEAELRRGLADTSLSSPEIEVARAVLGFFVTESRLPRRSRQQSVWFRIAAAIALAAVCGTVLLNSGGNDRTDNDRCVAYIGDTEITDNHKVMAMMRSELNDFGEASADMRDDIDDQLSILAAELSL